MSTDYLNTPDEAPVANYKVKLPKKAYTLRCVEAAFGRSKPKVDPKTGEATGNNPMYTRTWEVVSPESVRIKNVEKSAETGEEVFEDVIIAGLTVMDWLTLTSKTARVVKADANRLGIEPPDDDGSSVTSFIGKEAQAILRTDVQKAIDEETKQPIKLPNGEDKIDYRHQIAEWLG